MPGVAEVPAVVQTAAGDLRGTVDNGVAVWRGVPYAQLPVGERRFAAPAPLSPWTGVRDAVEHGPLPLQTRSMVANDRRDPTVRDEACLTITWVRENIAAFGGDADRVTVFGESAGATSVLALLASPAAEGLFAQAIAQSRALPLIADRETRAEQGQRFLSLLGVTDGGVEGLERAAAA